MNAVAAGATKKRKKSDTKPQAQINKCNNEKRRREQENIYIEELAELISANFGDMSSLSVKPDKCAILQETVTQIRNIKEREAAAALGGGGGGAPTVAAVQQGEVSSSRPTILKNDVIAPLLLEAIDGFLFVVNAEGKVEFITDNVITYIKFTREEVLGKSIYNIIHHGDHARFSSNLQPISMSWSGNGGAGDSTNTAQNNTNRSRSFLCRLLIKSPEDQDETIEEKQTRINQYEQMHISSMQTNASTLEPEDVSSDAGPCLMCLARRIPYCEKPLGAPMEQFTTKLDTMGKIVAIDISGVSALYSQYLNKDLMGRIIQDLCPQQELQKLAAHLKETLTVGQATSEIYRLRVTSSEKKYVRVQTKSKLFKNNPPEQDFIMATHSIIGEHESTSAELDSGGSSSGSVGGPLMTSALNGARNGVPTSRYNNTEIATASTNALTLTNNTPTYNTFTLVDNGMEFDFFQHNPSTWDTLSTQAWNEPTRPDSCQSVTPVSTPTPRPPSASGYSPVPAALSSPFNPQQSPSTANPQTPFNNTNFTFSPLGEPNFPADEPVPQKDSKEHVLEEASAMADSARLRNLLTKPPTTAMPMPGSDDSEARNKHRILKGLLNQEDDEENRSQNATSPRGLVGGRSNSVPASNEQPKHGNNMLLRLLNEKNDDDDIEQRAGLKNQSELLHQLLKDDEEHTPMEPQSQSQNDTLLRSLGFPNTLSPTSPDLHTERNRKRPSDERSEETHAKRPAEAVQVSSTGNSKLCERNKMLASLLAKQPTATSIPPIPASVISATPQEKLPRVVLGQQNAAVTSQANSDVRQNSRMRSAVRQTANSYLNQMLTPNADSHNMHSIRQSQQNRVQFSQMDTNAYGAATSSVENIWDIHSSSDPILSDILDQVIDIVPDAVISDSSAIMNLIDAIESPQNNNNFQQALNEKMAINAIQKSLMQCESAVKSPSSPTISMPGTPPAYSTALTSSQTNQTNFPPPPVYPRPNTFTIQRGAQQIRSGATQYTMTPTPQQQQLLMQQRKLLQQQEQHKRRLLQQQQQQQLLIQSNAVTAELNSGLQNIDSLLNNTVAPNVALQRSSSVPDSQLSPGYANSLMNVNNGNQTQRLNQQPYSPHSQLASPLGQQSSVYPQTTVNNFQQTGARLSPHPPFQQQQQSQQQQQQLSPRQAYLPAQTQTVSATWSQTQASNRLSLQQQQNPMLNAQLTGSYGGTNRGFPVQRQQSQPQVQQQRTLGSPGVAATRQSPFPADAFPPPASPTSGFANQSQYQQQMRLQRTISAPTATTQLPGGLGSPRQYAGRGDHPPGNLHPHQYPPPPPLPIPQQQPVPPHQHHQHQHPMMYQQESQYCYDQTGLQLAFNGADRGRGPPPHLQGGGAGGNGMNATSEYVRQELRAVVGARTGQSAPAPQGNVRPSLQLAGQQVSPTDLETLGLTFEMPTSGASDSPKLWGTMGSDMGSMSPQPPPTLSSSSRTTTEEMARPGDQKSSLLQKLLSE